MPRRKPIFSLYGQTVPEVPADSALYVIATPLLPYLIGALEEMRRSPVWASGEPEVLGNNLLGEQIMHLINPVLGTEQLYRWLETNFRGTVYNYTIVNGVPVISPEIPIVPDTTDAPLLPVLAHMQEIGNMFVTGDTVTGPITSDMSLQARLQEVIDAINSGDVDTADIIAKLAQIVLALA